MDIFTEAVAEKGEAQTNFQLLNFKNFYCEVTISYKKEL